MRRLRILDDAVMTGKALAWSGGIVTAVTSGGLIWYFNRVGLEKATSLAGVAGLFVAIASLIVTIWGLVLQYRPSGGGQHVAANVGGGVYQMRGATGSVKIKTSSSTPTPPPTPPAGAPQPPRAVPRGDQTVSGSISGPVHQVDGGTDIELE
ncbi:hypothetical protein [Streptomyces himalayensis]|uniref:Uncharacterized protein n=1 Tax=Streptomyces himalayensis subsp. himalayensis TaxID=2756131 RepID=A0A7W0DRN2_9ACTN|nr:hypothetical protein [Streptomyces himalayensis]MBA2949590.1 hypothetical protein [Streptomyces himalayensis subsp. himalayensis]